MTPELGLRAPSAERLVRAEAVVDAHIGLVLDAARASLESGWIAQTFSPIGRNRHCKAVRRRIAEWLARGGGEMDAAIVGRKYMLTIDALVDEAYRAECPRPSTLRRKSRPANDNGHRCRRGSPSGRCAP